MPRDGTETRKRIVDAVVALADKGVAAITIEAVTAASGTTNGSVYHHFGSRDGLLSSAIDRVFAAAMKSARPALDTRPAVDAISDFVGRYVSWVATHRREATVLYQAPLALQAAMPSPAKQEAFAPIGAWLAGRMDEGELETLDLALVDPVAFGPVHELCRRWLANPESAAPSDQTGTLAQAVVAILTGGRATAGSTGTAGTG
jgi:AcrR family transcriptional regulator